MPRDKQAAALAVPHSWDLENWPGHVYPGSESRARYLIRAYRTELLNIGALSRVGREIVILGSAYSRWLQSGAKNVPGYECNANRAQGEQAA